MSLSKFTNNERINDRNHFIILREQQDYIKNLVENEWRMIR